MDGQNTVKIREDINESEWNGWFRDTCCYLRTDPIYNIKKKRND